MTATLVARAVWNGDSGVSLTRRAAPTVNETTDDHNRHARRRGRACTRGRRVEQPGPDHAGRHPGARGPGRDARRVRLARHRRGEGEPLLGRRGAAGEPQAGRLRRQRPRRVRLARLPRARAGDPRPRHAALLQPRWPGTRLGDREPRPPRHLPSQRARVRRIRRGRRAAVPRASTSGRCGTSATSTPGSARSAPRACPCLPGSTAASTSRATAACARAATATTPSSSAS